MRRVEAKGGEAMTTPDQDIGVAQRLRQEIETLMDRYNHEYDLTNGEALIALEMCKARIVFQIAQDENWNGDDR